MLENSFLFFSDGDAGKLTVIDDWPANFDSKGRYFGFSNGDANDFFGTTNWNSQRFLVQLNNRVGYVKVWKDNTNCKMSCGRWDPVGNAGDWNQNDVIEKIKGKQQISNFCWKFQK